MKFRRISIAAPQIGAEEKAAVGEVLDGGRLVQGPRVAAFERAFAEFHGARFGIATNSGTSALITALRAHGIGPGSEVVVPAFSFFATASAVLAVGALPVFADVEPDTLCLSPVAAEAAVGERTRAVIVVHLYGHPADMAGFSTLCRARGLLLLEDAAHAPGARIGERSVGTWGTAAFSFHASKNLTTGEGGMVLTDDDAVRRRATLLRQQGMLEPHRHELVGYNFRMTEVAAALGLVQLARLPGFQACRAAHAARYDRLLHGVTLPTTRAGCVHAYHQYTIRVTGAGERDRVLARLVERGIEARVYYRTPIHRQPALAAHSEVSKVDLPITDRASDEVLSLPVHAALGRDDIEYVADAVNEAVASG